MRPVNRLTQQGRSARPTHRTKEDFLRWLREQDRGQGTAAAEEPGVSADLANSRALMVWADDGGAP
jgi:hypothetical protein